MLSPIVFATAAAAELDPEPIPKDWILSGAPVATGKKLAKSSDFTSYVMVWECTPGNFTWRYNKDETLVVLTGEVFITNENGQERRLGPGDLAFFPGGTSATWRVTAKVRKVAVVRETMPRALGLLLWGFKGVLRRAGLAGQSPLVWTFAAALTNCQ
jgi:uncharacterized protein